MKGTKIFLILFLLGNILSIQTSLEDTERKAIPINLGTSVKFNKTQNYFKFDYTDSSKAKIFISFLDDSVVLKITNPNGEESRIDESKDILVANLSYIGTYYLEMVFDDIDYQIEGIFNTLVIGGIMDIIDLNRILYASEIEINSGSIYYGYIEYKIGNLTEDIIIYFSNSGPQSILHNYHDYYPYYPDEDHINKPHDNLTIFEVIEIDGDKSNKNVKVFRFNRDKEYIIRIHASIVEERWGDYVMHEYIYLKYKFCPITSKNIKDIKGDEVFFSVDRPIIGIINQNTSKPLFIATDIFDQEIFYTRTNETIENDSDSLLKLNDFNFVHNMTLVINQSETSNIIFIILPNIYESITNIYITDEFDFECKDSYLVPANKVKYIFCFDEIKTFQSYNHITTLTSNKKNLRFIYSRGIESTDNMIFNYLGLPVIAERDNKDYKVILNRYEPKFTFFVAVNPQFFNAFINEIGKNLFRNLLNININSFFNSYKIPKQANIRINSNVLPWFEFYNIYLSQFELKINLYIKQIYGGSEIYECEIGEDEKDLTFLTTPITNNKCKNKRSIFNRLFTLEGTKILSGYITPDSYLDVYAEIEKENNKEIFIFNYTLENLNLTYTNNAKYLRKNVEYRLNFNANHMFKLESGYDVEIIITNGANTSMINLRNPIAEISGRGYTIKSTDDAMVYFIEKLNEQLINQTEIDIEKSKGKIIKISKVDSILIIDLGFKGYYPSTFSLNITIRNDGIFYLDNIYDKIKTKLLDDEKLYIYYMADSNKEMQIEYIENNLNNKNNDFNIFLIPNNNEINNLIIGAFGRTEIITDIHFCKDNTILNISVLGSNEMEEKMILTNDNYTSINNLSLFRGDNKISFLTNEPLIFSYSYFDLTDENFFGNYYIYRTKLDNLTIIEVTDKDDTSNIIKIKFLPNYRNSSTRYIIIVAEENSNNTIEQFKNPCYITDLLNQKPEGIKVEAIYDVGENNEIEAEVDISNILAKNNNESYLINIISQELRFEKKVNFYQPLQFNHKKRIFS